MTIGTTAPSILVPIERALVGWFTAQNVKVEHDGHEWFAWADGCMIPLTEIAVAIKLEIESATPKPQDEKR